MGKPFSEFTEEKLEQVRTHPYFEKARNYIRRRAEDYLKTDPPFVKFSDIHLYVTTGNRMVYQDVFNRYEDRMRTFFFAYLLDNDEKYIMPLSDMIWAICNFESWSLPAHVFEHHELHRRRTWLDLTSTILGFRIAEILYYIGDKLPELVARRAKAEVRERVIDSWKTASHEEGFHWLAENYRFNWSAVCIASILCCYMYLGTPSETNAQIPRMCKSIDLYLEGFDPQGCCNEGYSYWNYGFSYFCLFASMLRDFTDGKIDYFKNPKVHEIAKFQQNVSMNEKEAVSFSDCTTDFRPAAFISHFLKKEYPDIEIPSLEVSLASPLRYVIWCEPEFADCKMNPKTFTYHETQWFLYRSPEFNFAIKAGCNDESHNHNDVGSFIISKNDKVTFCDPGKGEYTRQYFTNERYDNIGPSSRGHSVPIINGHYQIEEKEKCEILTETDHAYAFNMQQTYDDKTLKRLYRGAFCEGEKLTLTDEFSFTEVPESLTERFVSLIKPEKTEEGFVKVGDTVLSFDREAFTLSFSEEPFPRDHGKDTLYVSDLTVKKPEKEMKFTFTFI